MKFFALKKALAFTALASSVAFSGCQKEELMEEQFASPTDTITASNNNGQLIEGQYIVVFKDGSINTMSANISEVSNNHQIVSATIRQSVMAQAGIGEEDVKETFQGTVKGFAARLTASQLQKLRNNPEVAYIEQDRIVSLFAAPAPASTGRITREHWSNVGGNSVSNIPLSTAPTNTSELSLFEAPSNIGDNYGARVRGFVTAPTTGQYTFWIAADDVAELWLSTSEDPSQKVKIAHIAGWVGFRKWTNFPSQQSAKINLVAGKRYYIEALHKERNGGDHLAVGWQLPSGALERPIPGNRLSVFETTVPDAEETEDTGDTQDPGEAEETNEVVEELYKKITPLAGETVPWHIARVGYGDGTGKNVWVIDSGINTAHPDLTVDVARSKSFVSGVTSIEDGLGHGTSVAGVIAAKNNGSGLIGVASGATIIALRVFDDAGKGTMSNIISAVLHVNANGKEGDVVNMSLGGGVSNTLDNVVKSAALKGIQFVMAAGNSGVDCSNNSPARIITPGSYTISAMDSYGKLWDKSNYGLPVAFAAPGLNLTVLTKSGHAGGGFGTSFAAPHVAGILALTGKINSNGVVTGDKDDYPDPIASLD